MATATKQPQTVPVYETDFYEWTRQQAQALAGRRTIDLDWDNLAEEVESVGRAQKNEIYTRLYRLLRHLLRWHYQSEKRCHSWQSTIGGQRMHIAKALEASASLHRYPSEIAERVYQIARREASAETGLPMDVFPNEMPYRIEDVLRFDLMPGRPWSPDELIRD